VRLRLAVVVLVALVPTLVAQSSPGVVVERVDSGAMAQAANLLPGDLLFSWSQGTDSGVFESPFDVLRLEVDRAGRGPIEIAGSRNGTRQSWTIAAGRLGLVARPSLDAATLAAHERAAALTASDDLAAARAWSEAAALTSGERSAAWLQFLAAQAFSRTQQWDGADRAFAAALAAAATPDVVLAVRRAWGATLVQRGQWVAAHEQYDGARAAARTANWPLGEAVALTDVGRLQLARSQLKEAEGTFREAQSTVQRLAPGSVAYAAATQGIGQALIEIGNLAAAQPFHTEALQIFDKVSPGSLDVAINLHALGRIAQERGDLKAAEAHYRRSLAITDVRARDSAQWASTVNNLGNVLRGAGDLVEAERHVKMAYTAMQRLAPDSLGISAVLNNLGIIAQLRGDLVRADTYYRQALAITERLAPGTIRPANNLVNLGLLAKARREWALAEDYLRQALTLTEKVSQGTMYHARILNNLGTVAEERGDLVEAERYHQAALRMRLDQKADDMLVGTSLHNIGVVRERRGQLVEAEEYYGRSLDALRRAADGSLQVATILFSLGDVARKREQWPRAEELYQQAFDIRRRLAPDSLDHAESLHALAQVALHRKDVAAAQSLLEQSLAALEAQAARVGGPQDTRAAYRADFGGFYRQALDLLVSQDRQTEAFHVLERSRARAQLETLASRSLSFADLSADLESAWARLAVEYDRVQADIGERDAAEDQEAISDLTARLRQLNAERASLLGRMRDAAPELAGLRSPRPADLEAARQALDAGTVMLNYSIGPERAVLFVIGAAHSPLGLAMLPIPVREQEIRVHVQGFRDGIAARTRAGRATFETHARWLYDQLVAPAAHLLEDAERVVVVPDGPLNTLPFGALLRTSTQYFIEWKPVHTTVSVTLYAYARSLRREDPRFDTELVAFADPQYPTAAAGGGTRRGGSLAPLPFSRTEAERIARPFGERAHVYAGVDATEARARTEASGARYVHFAVHGLVDDEFPLNSALALTSASTEGEDRDNGLLQAWEIYERVRWKADLIVLSACESGLGRELASEGLVGLTQAIHFAGARSVLASMWSVDDRRTAQFMERFYAHLRGGASKDRALRATQLEFLRSDTNRQPFHWAAFVLTGDWR
jgi:CHAT domain-containing protein/tetratricopeptide (TPR) repeat protein